MENFAGYFFTYMAGVATPLVILIIGYLCSNKTSIRDYLSGGKNG